MAHWDEKPHILITNEVDWPGNVATGPNCSISALIHGLKDQFRFTILGSDRPRKRGNSAVKPVQEPSTNDNKVFYEAPGISTLKRFGILVAREQIDLIWMQSFFSPWHSIGPILTTRLNSSKPIPTLISPRGEFSPQALQRKALKKRVSISIARTFGLTKPLYFHATSNSEANQIESTGLENAGTFVVPDTFRLQPQPIPVRQIGDKFRIVFVGRIHPMKAVHRVIEMLQERKSPTHLDIYGPIQDQEYYQYCQRTAKLLPENVTVRWCGLLQTNEVVPTIASYDLLALLSDSESFGHVIFEALSAGTPVVIGTNTPWSGVVDARAGWIVENHTNVIPTDAIDRIELELHQSRTEIRDNARTFAEKHYQDTDTLSENAKLIRHLVKEL